MSEAVEDPVAYRFRDPEMDTDWNYAAVADLDEDSRQLLEEKGWEVQPLTVLEDEDG